MTDTHTVGDAIKIAINWITESNLPFISAFISGSVANANEALPYDPTSDIDCYLVVEGDPPGTKIGKFTVSNVLLDVSWLAWTDLQQGKTDAVLASLLRFGRVVHDDGRLGPLKDQFTSDFTTSEAVTGRIESMRTKIRHGLKVDSSHLSHPEQVINWLFPATLATHIPLIATCSPLTVRKRFLAARNVMMPQDYETLLQLFGFDTVTRQQAQEWLNDTARLFDATIEIAASSSRFWASDIQATARHIAIGGSQQLIDTGDHREALYWIVATSSRCFTIRADANIGSTQFLREYWQMLKALRMESMELRHARSRAILDWIG